MKNNNFLDFLTCVNVYVCIYTYISREIAPKQNEIPRWIIHEDISTTKTSVNYFFSFFFFFSSISILSSRDVKLKNRTRNRNAWRSLKFSRIQACNYLLVTVEILEARNIGIRTGLRERHHCLMHAYSICIVSLINVRSKRNTVVSRSFIKFRYCTFVFLRFLPFNLPRII